MKCYCCDVILTPQESTRKFAKSKTYTDMCNKCLSTIDEPTIDSTNEFEQEDNDVQDNYD